MPYSIIKERVDPRLLSVNITASNGKVYRWGPDEADSANVPSGIHIASRIPGGFATLDCTLERRPDLTYNDFDRFAPATVTGIGGMVAFDGYLASRPMDRGDTYSFSPQAIGWSGHMKDYPAFTMVYIDRMLSKWVPPTIGRNIQLVGASIDITAITSQAVASVTGTPAILLSTTGPITGATNHNRCEVWYDSGANNLIAKFQYSALVGMNMAINDVNSSLDVGNTNDSSAGGNEVSYSNSSPFSNTWSSPGRYSYFYWQYNATGGATGQSFGFNIENPAVIGNHGLSLRAGPSGTSPGVDDGFYGSDIIADIISRAAPQLTYTTGATGSIQPTSFVIPQMAFNSPVDADAAVQQVNQYFLYDYGVYENKQFFWRPPGSGRQWHVRLSNGVFVQDQGPQIETAFNGVVVQYTDPAGTTRYVGPPSFLGDKDPVSGATSSSLLLDTSITNPVNLYGRKRWALVQMGTTTWQGAVTVGQIFLAAALNRPSAGSATIQGFATDSAGKEWPVWMIRAGDTITIDDSNDTSAHYVLETSYNHDSLTLTATLDAPPNRLDWILQRLNLVISPLG